MQHKWNLSKRVVVFSIENVERKQSRSWTSLRCLGNCNVKTQQHLDHFQVLTPSNVFGVAFVDDFLQVCKTQVETIGSIRQTGFVQIWCVYVFNLKIEEFKECVKHACAATWLTAAHTDRLCPAHLCNTYMLALKGVFLRPRSSS